MRLTVCILSILVIVQLNSANIESDLLEFVNLIPKNRIAFLSGRHFLFDVKFRTAINYLRSSNFEVLVREEISKSPEVQDVVAYLGREIDLNVIPKKIRGLIILLRPAQEYGSVRGSSDFVREVAELLPDREIAGLIKEKSSKDVEFAELFSKITDIECRELVYRARNSESMAVAVKVLRNYHVEFDQIIEIAFEKINKWKE